MSLIKSFQITERQSVQFRTEFFNTFNHPQFLPPGNGAANPGQLQVSSATFGQINTSSVNPRILQFALKYIF